MDYDIILPFHRNSSLKHAKEQSGEKKISEGPEGAGSISRWLCCFLNFCSRQINKLFHIFCKKFMNGDGKMQPSYLKGTAVPGFFALEPPPLPH